MNIGQLIQTLIATIVGSIIGGLIVISTNWIKEKGERRRATQERYEQIYIIEGIDPLAAYYQSLSLNIINKANDRTISIVEKDIPVEAITKVRILLVDVVPLNIIFRAHAHLANTDDRDMLGSVASLMQDAVEALINYRIQLTAKILISVNSLQHERETTQLTSELNEVWSGLAYLEKQRLNEEREARAQLKLPDLPAMRKRKDRFPRIK